MLPESKRRITKLLGDGDKVLDVGGWSDPFARADWVLDLMPYESRGLYERKGWVGERESEPERFTAQTWLQRDACDREPWPFEDDSFDFVVCSHTLEDVRDPLWMCSELARVAKAGYVEVPSRLEEQCWGVAGPYVGWSHHHWLIDAADASIEFVFKPHSLHNSPQCFFPPGFHSDLEPAERVQSLWWTGSFEASERYFVEEPIEPYLSGFVAREMAGRDATRRGPRGFRRRLAARLVGA